MPRSSCCLALAGLLLSTAAAAQAPPRFAVDLSALVAQPVGEFNDYVDVGFGLGGSFRVRLDPAGAVWFRVDGGFVNYGRVTQQVCLSATVGCRIVVDLETTNNIGLGEVGLQLEVPRGPVRPYVNGGIGYSYFFTESSVSGDDDFDPFASTRNFDDGSFTWGAGGGLKIPLSQGSTTFALDMGARFHNNGTVDYLTEGSIVDRPDGSIDIFPTRSAAHIVTYFVGVTIGFGAR
jgi:hypothetical protein